MKNVRIILTTAALAAAVSTTGFAFPLQLLSALKNAEQCITDVSKTERDVVMTKVIVEDEKDVKGVQSPTPGSFTYYYGGEEAAEEYAEYEVTDGDFASAEVADNSDFTIFGMKPKFHPHVSTSFTYDDNILTEAWNPKWDYIFTVAPGASFELGADDPDNPDYSRFFASYTANFIMFMENSELDTIDQEAFMQFRYDFGKLMVGLEQEVQTLSDSTIDIGTRSSRDYYGTRLFGKYTISPKTNIEATAAQFVTNYTGDLTDKNEWVLQTMFNYQISPKVTIGVGPLAGWVDFQNNPNQTYQQILGRILWQASAKLAVNLTGGVELRQWQDGVLGDRIAPIMELGVNYLPFDGTTLSMLAFHGIKNSAALIGQNFESTGVTLAARQRFLRDFYFMLSGSYEVADYYQANPGIHIPREDAFYSIRASVSYAFADWGTIEMFYQYRDNHSSQDHLSFENNLYGIQATFVY